MGFELGLAGCIGVQVEGLPGCAEGAGLLFKEIWNRTSQVFKLGQRKISLF